MGKTNHVDSRRDYIRRLHQAYVRGRLNVFVGAGISQASGFAGWEKFNKELMRRYLASEIGNATPAAMLASSNITSTAEELYEALGRDAVADFVYRATRTRFGKLLASVLYQDPSVRDLPVRSVHRQIASLCEKARLFTLNFDPLLELALAKRFPRKQWLEFRSPSHNGNNLRRKYKVEHLHGWVDIDGKTSPKVVLTESDYLELTSNPKAAANRFLRDMLATSDTTLILGMSLADQNFRRVLYFLNKQKLSSRERIYVMVRRQKPAVDHYAQLHWLRRGLRLFFIEHYDEIPGLLRDIEWGEPDQGQIPRWTGQAISWRQEVLPDVVVFTDTWQEIAHESLVAVRDEIKSLFAVPSHETIHTALFIPFWDSAHIARLRMIASSRTRADSRGALHRARHRILSIQKGNEQGIAGVCFSTGTTRTVAFGEGEVDINFSSQMSQRWTSQAGYRDWRSIIAVPVIDTDSWVPTAVITLTSNMPNPFWTQFGSKSNLLEPELHTAMRRAAYFCLRDFATMT